VTDQDALIESPDDAPSDERWETLSQAFAAYRYPLENRSLVQRLVDAIGIDHYEGIASRSYIRAIRRGAGRLVHIHFGYTGGLGSEEEILDAVGDVDRGSWSDGREWWIVHPLNKLRGANGAGATSRSLSDYGQCPIHFLALPATGRCDACSA
jgi:hypothetical protein